VELPCARITVLTGALVGPDGEMKRLIVSVPGLAPVPFAKAGLLSDIPTSGRTAVRVRRSLNTSRHAFTLVELLALLVMLALIAIPLVTVLDQQSVRVRARRIPDFPWEPPTPTTYVRLPDEFGLSDGARRTYGDLAGRLEAALTKAGYSEKSFYNVPGGFALVCRMEQIDADWRPVPPPHRWGETPPPLRDFSVADYLTRLFLAPAGRYRLLVFVVTDRPFTFAARKATSEEGKTWLFGGATGLPPEMAATPAATGTKCFALVYEFKKDDKEAVFVSNETVGALVQLQRTGVL
jgi:hypothetical protein